MEEALEPDLEIVDPHHHLWDFDTPYGRYELADLKRDTGAGHNVVETVFVECSSNYFETGPEHLRPVGETVFVAAQADLGDQTPGARITGIVGRADLTGPAVAEVLDAHIEAAGGRFRGIRHAWAMKDGDDVHLYKHDNFQAGCRVLASYGLSFDAWQYHFQLDDVASLARAVPELSIVVDHVGGPLGIGRFAGKRDEVLAETKAGLAVLSELDNVTLKVGGIGMVRYGTEWVPNDRPPNSDDVLDAWGDMMRWCIDTFGPSRCMFESNFSVDAQTTSYVVLWNAFKRISAGYSDAERADLFAGTARRVYRLPKSV